MKDIEKSNQSLCVSPMTDPVPEHGTGCNNLLIIYQYSKSSNRQGPDICYLVVSELSTDYFNIKVDLCHSPLHCKMELTILSSLIMAWGKLCICVQLSVFHSLPLSADFFVVMVMLLRWLTNFPSKTDKNWNDGVSGRRISGRWSKVGNAVPDIKQPTLSHLREGLLPGYFSNKKLPGFKTTEAFLLWELCALQIMINTD